MAQLRTVPPACYREHRKRLHQASEPQRFLNRLHRNPTATIQSLIASYNARRSQLLTNEKSLTNQPVNTG
jgi:hypothetical protein